MTYDEILDIQSENPLPMTPAERTRQWRQNMRQSGRPDMRAIDAALGEAASFLLSLVKGTPVTIEITALVRVATINLVRDGYDRTLSKTLVINRIRPRPVHDVGAYMPSRQLAAVDADVRPPKAGAWSGMDTAYIRSLASK